MAERWRPDDPANHMETCPDCGATFDMRDLAAVLSHVHDSDALAQIRGVIGDAAFPLPGTEVLDPDE